MIACPICGNDITDFHEIVRCPSCSHVFTSKPETYNLYSHDYYSLTHKKWFNNPNKRLFSFICQKIKHKGGSFNLLDVGCGNGDFLEYAIRQYPHARLTGIDFKLNVSDRIQYICGDFMTTQFDAQFDVIVSLAVIEHLSNPREFMSKITDTLCDGGLLIITTVNNDSLCYIIARMLNRIGLRTPYKRLYNKHHLQHYTNASLRKLIKAFKRFVLIKQINHNYSLNSVDVPATNIAVRWFYLCMTGLIFGISGLFGAGILQTVVYRKKGGVDEESVSPEKDTDKRQER